MKCLLFFSIALFVWIVQVCPIVAEELKKCHTSSTDSTDGATIDSWDDLKSFINQNEDQFQDLLLTASYGEGGADDSRIRQVATVQGPWPAPLNTRFRPLNMIRETYDTGGGLSSCEQLGHTAWSNMVDIYSESPSTNSFAPAYKQKVEALLADFPAAVKRESSENFKYLLFLKKPDRLTSSIKSECKNGGDDGLRNLLKESLGRIINHTTDKQIQELLHFRQEIDQCEAMLGLTKWSDFSSVEDGVEENKKSASFDGRIRCRSSGNNTQDYPKCKSAINFYNTSAVAGNALQQVQNTRHQGKMLEGQQKVLSQGSINHTGALEYQKEGIKSMQGVANQRAVFDGIKLAKFLEIVKGMPTTKSLLHSCTERLENNVQQNSNKLFVESVKFYKNHIKTFFEQDSGLFSNNTPAIDFSAQTICMNAIKNEFSLIRNQKARDVAKQMAMQSGIEMGTNLANAHLLGKQANQLDNIIKKIDEYNPRDALGTSTEALKIKECQLNPLAPHCRQAGGDFRSLDPSLGSITVRGGDQEESGGAGALGAKGDESKGQRAPSQTGPRHQFSGNITPFPTNINKGGNGISSPVAPSRSKPGGGGPGGGSGGGGSSGGPGGGLGGSPSGPQGKRKVRPHKMKKIAAGYSGKGGSLKGFYTTSGGRKKNKSKSGSENPFKNLFKNRSPSNKALLFKDIGGTGSSLFKRISKRYKVIYEQDRLQVLDEDTPS